jgi:hypothetical protein
MQRKGHCQQNHLSKPSAAQLVIFFLVIRSRWAIAPRDGLNMAK